MEGDLAEPTEPTDADLLAAHVAGDADAFGVLFARHRDRLWAVALRTTGHPETAADGLQDGLVAAYRRAASFRGDARVTTWLHRVVVNACLDRLRADQVRATTPLPDEPASATDGSRGSPRTATAPDPADHAMDAERRELVLAALAALPAEQRAAVVLVDMEGYAVAEVAEILDCAVGTVKSRCARGRAKLTERLRPLISEDGTDAPPPTDTGGNRASAPDVGSVSRRGPPEDGSPDPTTP